MLSLVHQYADSTDIAPSTVAKMRHRIGLWLRHLGQTDPSEDAFKVFRHRLKSSHSAATIEETINDVRRVWRHSTGTLVPVGRRLVVIPPEPEPPTLEMLGKFYQHTHVAEWPRVCDGWLRCSADQWWKSAIVTAFWTAFRRCDLFSLTWENLIPEAIKVSARKTRRHGRRHAIPMTKTIMRHFLPLQHHEPYLFGVLSIKSARREMARIAESAKVKYFTWQQLRQAGITAWSSTNAEAGRIVHGCGLGVMRYYLEPLRVLEAVKESVELPKEWLTESERDESTKRKAELIRRYERAPSAKKRFLEEAARQIG